MNKISILYIPIGTYFISYVVLAHYHNTPFLLNRIVHESGTLTLLETIGYAPHALAHIPVHSIVAMLFCGWYVWLGGPIAIRAREARFAAIACMVLLGALVWISISRFGLESTYAYITQHKQSEVRYVHGGSWLLHMPSMLTLVGLVPLYLVACFKIWNAPQVPLRRSWVFFAIAIVCLVVYSVVVMKPVIQSLNVSLSDPRYLAHSMREVATFPLTYFPIPLYILIRRSKRMKRIALSRMKTITIVILMVITSVAIAFQVIVALNANIQTLAQRPDFTNGTALPTSYLLASHYFEHVTDTVYFTCFVIIFLYMYSRLGKFYDASLDTTAQTALHPLR